MTMIAMPQWRTDADPACPVADTIDALSGKWKPRLIHILLHGDRHFLAVVRALPGASRKVIAAQLRELEADGIVARTPLDDPRRRVLYALTPRGQSLAQVLGQLYLWAVDTAA